VGSVSHAALCDQRVVDTFQPGLQLWGMRFRRSVLLVALACLLLNAFDCFGAGLISAQARKCCASGHCSPKNLDSCCKNAPSGANQALLLHPKVSVQKPIANITALNPVPVTVSLALRFDGIRAPSDDHPPGRLASNQGLPLRI
jgi:hypothetical protein